MARWLIWIAVVIVWTVGLQYPVPEPGSLPAGEFISINRFLLGKALHMLVYAGLTVLSAWTPMAVRYRWMMMFFLMLHAWGGEMLQEALNPWCHRGGSLADVGFDFAGIALGAAASWKWWARE